MRLPLVPSSYSIADQREMRRTLELDDSKNHKRGSDVEIGVGRLILTSPNGTRYSITVSNAGVISAVAV
jgi:hypothetical protein